MKRSLTCLLILGVVICLFSGCAAPITPSVTTTTTTVTTTTTATELITTTTTALIVMIDPMNNECAHRFHSDFAIGSLVSSLVDEDKYQAWCDTFEHFDKGGTRNKYDYNLYTLIHEFSIPREKIEEACRFYDEIFPEDEYLSKEQLDMLYNGEEVEVYQYFANPGTVAVGKEVYTIKWLTEHTAEEYAAVGITHAGMAKKMDVMLSLCPEIFHDYLRTQLAALKELER